MLRFRVGLCLPSSAGLGPTARGGPVARPGLPGAGASGRGCERTGFLPRPSLDGRRGGFRAGRGCRSGRALRRCPRRACHRCGPDAGLAPEVVRNYGHDFPPLVRHLRRAAPELGLRCSTPCRRPRRTGREYPRGHFPSAAAKRPGLHLAGLAVSRSAFPARLPGVTVCGPGRRKQTMTVTAGGAPGAGLARGCLPGWRAHRPCRRRGPRCCCPAGRAALCSPRP